MPSYALDQKKACFRMQNFKSSAVTVIELRWSKQVNRVNIETEILHGNWSSYWKYKEVLLTLSLLVKLTLSIHYYAGHTSTMQELVKEVTLKSHSNNGFVILHGINKLSP